MSTVKDKKKKQDLGIYYTPEPVVDFIYDILNVLKKKDDEENNRWESREPKPHYPSVIDPACGEGIFLKKAIESGFTGSHPSMNVPYIFGIDIDDSVVDRWEEISILELFNGNRKSMENHFYHQNGLRKLEKKTLRYKKGGLQEFDAVVGNPPYGGLGVDISKNDHLKLYQDLLDLEICRKGKSGKKVNKKGPNVSPDDVMSIPIEILFLNRFIDLAKPGGWVAIIIPDGILANSTMHYVREFIAEKTQILGIVSLPRETFKDAGTNAKTSIMFLRKYDENEASNDTNLNYNTFLSSVQKVREELFDKLSEDFKYFYNNGELPND